MRVTVVIPALNEAGNIGRLVEETYAAVPAQRLSELIVVDDASDDATPREIRRSSIPADIPACAICATSAGAARARRCARACWQRRARSSPPWTATARTTPAIF